MFNDAPVCTNTSVWYLLCILLLRSNSQTLLFLFRFWYVFFVVLIFQHFCFELSSRRIYFIHWHVLFVVRSIVVFFFFLNGFCLTWHKDSQMDFNYNNVVVFFFEDNFYQYMPFILATGEQILTKVFENSLKSNN